MAKTFSTFTVSGKQGAEHTGVNVIEEGQTRISTLEQQEEIFTRFSEVVPGSGNPAKPAEEGKPAEPERPPVRISPSDI